MTVLEQMERGAARMAAFASGHRAYRFDGEKANHAAQLSETRAAIAGMEKVAAAGPTPEQQFWLNQHRAGMEDRLAVFEGKPRLTVEEMNERDAIETHLYGAPLPRLGVSRVQGLLSPLATGAPWMAILASPVTWIAAGVAAFGVQTARLEHAKHDLANAQRVARQNAVAAHTWEERAHAYEHATADAAAAARITTQTLEAERARARAAAAREQRRQRDIAQVTHGGPAPDWDSSLRGDTPPEGEPSTTPAAATRPPG